MGVNICCNPCSFLHSKHWWSRCKWTNVMSSCCSQRRSRMCKNTTNQRWVPLSKNW